MFILVSSPSRARYLHMISECKGPSQSFRWRAHEELYLSADLADIMRVPRIEINAPTTLYIRITI